MNVSLQFLSLTCLCVLSLSACRSTPVATPGNEVSTFGASDLSGQLLFQHKVDGQYRLSTLDAHTLTTSEVITEPGSIEGTWSRDASLLLYGCTVSNRFQICTYDMRNKEIVQLTKDASNHWGPEWVNNEQSVLFVSDIEGGSHIYQLDIQTNEIKRLFKDMSGNQGAPKWSNKAGMLAFANLDQGQMTIYLSKDLEAYTSLSNSMFRDRPIWSPDGNLMVVQERDTNISIYDSGEIVVTDIVGNSIKKLTQNNFGDYWPVFSPDGNWIAFSTPGGDGNIVFYQLATDAITETQIQGSPLQWK